MIKCKVCKNEVHYCSSCDRDYYRDNNFCSEDCFKKSDVFKSFYRDIKLLWESLDDKQKMLLWCLWDNGYLIDLGYEKFVDDIFIKPED